MGSGKTFFGVRRISSFPRFLLFNFTDRIAEGGQADNSGSDSIRCAENPQSDTKRTDVLFDFPVIDTQILRIFRCVNEREPCLQTRIGRIVDDIAERSGENSVENFHSDVAPDQSDGADVSNYKKTKSTRNILYIIKQKIISHLDNHPYLNAFILGDKSYIKTSVLKSYQENAISHLFAISGMHISLLSSIILKILKRITSEEKSYLVTSIFLIIYLFLVGLSPSILRGVLFFILFSINKVYYFYIKPINIFILTLSITLLINPLYIYDIAFQYSFLISFTLIYMSDYLKGTYFISLLKVSFLSFIVSIPISLINYFQINILSIIYNLIYVPFISIIVFPLTLITSIFKFLLPIYNLLIYLLETTSILLSKLSILKLIFYRLPNLFYII